MKKGLISLCAFSMMFVSGCNQNASAYGLTRYNHTKPQLVREHLEVEKNVVDTYNQFAYKTTKDLYEEGTNMVYAPSSFIFPLTIIDQGCEGQSKTDLEAFTGMNDMPFTSNILFKATVFDNEEIGEHCLFDNILIVKENEPSFIKDSFKDILSTFYHGSLGEWNLNSKQAEEALTNFVKENTNGKFEPKFDFTENTEMVAINTFDYKNHWNDTFEACDPITFNDSYEVDAFNVKESHMGYYENDDFISIRVFLNQGDELIIGMPKNKDYKFKDENHIQEMLEADMEIQQVNLTLPKIELQSKHDLYSYMQKESLDNVLHPTNGYPNMLTNKNVCISDMYQEAMFSMNEDGIDAGAYTVAICKTTALRPMDEIIDLIVDRPFVYAIKTYSGFVVCSGIYCTK